MNKVMITGGAGFIGENLTRQLSDQVEQILVYDNLHPQVHGTNSDPISLPENAHFILGDIRDMEKLSRCISSFEPDTIFHLAAETGTGQSYDQPDQYCAVNVCGTAKLVEAIRRRKNAVGKVVLASSRAVYGEGWYRNSGGEIISPQPRLYQELTNGNFEPVDEHDALLLPLPTNETAKPAPASIYASTKLMQEYILTQGFDQSEVAVCILRLQNVYGPGQSLRNPYTGVLTHFANLIVDSRTINVYEDGKTVRDFVYIDDVVRAFLTAGRSNKSCAAPINIGSGTGTTILDAARLLMRILKNPNSSYEVTGDFRPGDVRFAVADIKRAKVELGWKPTVAFENGLKRFCTWACATKKKNTVREGLAFSE